MSGINGAGASNNNIDEENGAANVAGAASATDIVDAADVTDIIGATANAAGTVSAAGACGASRAGAGNDQNTDDVGGSNASAKVCYF